MLHHGVLGRWPDGGLARFAGRTRVRCAGAPRPPSRNRWRPVRADACTLPSAVVAGPGDPTQGRVPARQPVGSYDSQRNAASRRNAYALVGTGSCVPSARTHLLVVSTLLAPSAMHGGGHEPSDEHAGERAEGQPDQGVAARGTEGEPERATNRESQERDASTLLVHASLLHQILPPPSRGSAVTRTAPESSGERGLRGRPRAPARAPARKGFAAVVHHPGCRAPSADGTGQIGSTMGSKVGDLRPPAGAHSVQGRPDHRTLPAGPPPLVLRSGSGHAGAMERATANGLAIASARSHRDRSPHGTRDGAVRVHA